MKKHAINNKLAYKDIQKNLLGRFEKGESIYSLMATLSAFCENKVIHCWHTSRLSDLTHISLIALGSFGRQELHPYSDLDILILLSEPSAPPINRIEHFIQQLWDSGFNVGHQVTTIPALLELCKNDVTTLSSLMDMRLLTGNCTLTEELAYAIRPHNIWPCQAFLEAKIAEQYHRHKKYSSTAYNLEPNVKNGPGGLRDIQTILWIAQRYFGDRNLKECRTSSLITDNEYLALNQCQLFLTHVRFLLHLVAAKAEERVLFNYQSTLATYLGYNSQPTVEKRIAGFMQQYFRTIKRIRELNELLLQLFRELTDSNKTSKIKPLNVFFQNNNGYIEVRNSDAFKKRPQALFEVFYLLDRHPEIVGIKANTIRLLRKNNHLIDKSFRKTLSHTQFFLTLIKDGNNVYQLLKSMHRYGLLQRYIPQFGLITGQMQYDLFHVYTVDQHSLFVIKNLEKFKQESTTFELCHDIFLKIPKKECLYIAALFHDIGKGRGGDHSLIGEKDVKQFCKAHHLTSEDTNLIAFLVKNHLLLSQTAQRKDIDDPHTISEFCMVVSCPSYLDHLYLLTIADICATNKKLWNQWKGALLKRLYLKAKHRFALTETMDECELIERKQEAALKNLNNLKKETVSQLWQTFKKSYFLQEEPYNIAAQTKAILTSSTFPLIQIKPYASSGIHIFIYMPYCEERVNITTTLLSNYGLTIVEARILKCRNGFVLDNYIILEQESQTILSNKFAETLTQTLLNHLTPPLLHPAPHKRHVSTLQKRMPLKPQVTFTSISHKNYDTMVVIATDRYALLANISQILYKENIQIHNAKITTSGDQIEDTFFISYDNAPLTEEKRKNIYQKVMHYLTTNN